MQQEKNTVRELAKEVQNGLKQDKEKDSLFSAMPYFAHPEKQIKSQAIFRRTLPSLPLKFIIRQFREVAVILTVKNASTEL